MYLAEFITVAVVHILGVMSPGPDFAMVTRNSLVYSRSVGVFTALGVTLGVVVHITYSLLGISLIISQSILLFNVIKYLGAAYLLYIGYKSLRAKPHTESTESPDEAVKKRKEFSPRRSVWIGFLTNILNPKATLFFLAIFTQVISPATPKLIQSLYGVVILVITFAWFAFVAGLFSNTFIKSRLTKVQHHIERVTGAVLIALGIKVALDSQ